MKPGPDRDRTGKNETRTGGENPDWIFCSNPDRNGPEKLKPRPKGKTRTGKNKTRTRTGPDRTRPDRNIPEIGTRVPLVSKRKGKTVPKLTD